MENFPMFMDRKIVLLPILPKMIHGFNAIPIKIQSFFYFPEMENPITKFNCFAKGPK